MQKELCVYSFLRPAIISVWFLISACLFLVHRLPVIHAKIESYMQADVVLGQPDFTSNAINNGGVSARSLRRPYTGIQTDGGKLFVADFRNHRVLIWNKIPTKNFTPADVVIGQPDFTSSTSNNGGIGANTLSFPGDLLVMNDKLFVADENNSRVLIWNSIPTTNFVPADIVLGQPTFAAGVANNGGVSASSMNQPRGIVSDGKRLVIADGPNDRILIWNSLPRTSSRPADLVLGQPNFTSNTANNGGRSNKSLNWPLGLSYDGKHLIVGELSNNRVLIWNSIPTQNQAEADVVLGQPDFQTGRNTNGGVSAKSMGQNDGLRSNGKHLFVTDQQNHRILVWDEVPTENFANADYVIGQRDFAGNRANSGGISARTVNNPIGVWSDGRNVYVSDTLNHRVLIYHITESDLDDLGPQFSQGKAVLGKVFWDFNGDGTQNSVKG